MLGLSNVAIGSGGDLEGLLSRILNQLLVSKSAFLVQLPLIVLVIVLVTSTRDFPSTGTSKLKFRSRDYFGPVTVCFLDLMMVYKTHPSPTCEYKSLIIISPDKGIGASHCLWATVI